MLLHLYRLRLRAHAIQELLAGSGIAVGVALVLGVLVANTSLTGSAGELIHQVVGSARLQMSSRSPDGFDQSLIRKARGLPGVIAAAGVLRQNVTVVGAHGREAIQLLGVSPSLTLLGGIGSRDFGPGGFRFAGGLVLPAEVAAATGATQGQRVTILARGQAHTIQVGAILGSANFGALASSPVAVTLLASAQRLTAMRGRVNQLLVRPLPSADRQVSRELERIAGTLNVSAADHELVLLNEAAKPNEQSTSLFAAISVMVGFLLALNAMLLTVPERRRFVADLRMQGYDWRQILVLLGFQALVLGLLASGAGVLLGALISRAFLHRIPAYLITAFPVGTQEILHAGTVLIALGCGVLATMLASLSPILDLRPNRPTDAVLRDRAGGASEVLAHRTVLRLALASIVATVLLSVIVLLEPGLTILGGVVLALTTLGAIPALFAGVARALRWMGERVRSSALIVVVSELRAVTTRSVALAGVAALAVYGSVAIGGARLDLLHGLNANFSEYLGTADVWVTTGGNDLTTNPFLAGAAPAQIAHARGVRSVRSYQGGFLDVGSRRLWIIARPPEDVRVIPASQLLHGNLARASELVRGGGWAAISEGFATEHHLHVGADFMLPTPSGQARFGVAAITTNLGWSPGAVIMSTADYRAHWQTTAPTALEVNLAQGVSEQAGRLAVVRAIGARPGLGVQSLHERRAQYGADSRQGLRALSEIATLILIAAALAVASALSAAVWQRRARLASLKIQGYGTVQLWRALLLESAIVLSVGCVIGALAGVYGHALASRWLRLSTGFPAPFSFDVGRVLYTLALLAVISLAVIALPGLAAARAPARASLQE
jgi:putative ABC transport system permease protein